ncbi:Ger(x)C family spore germination protein [Paenibacillus sp. GCM10023250]|uniref:Ger(x)C family spore germination protein n=1 Tax=Paenibacillus sp. GCM10023250 TaxID=3252648 RepID=UPI0036242CD8
MNARWPVLLLLAFLCVSLLAGCGNRREPDHLAFDMGDGLDLTKDGKLEVSFQIAIPSGIGGGGEGAWEGGGSLHETFDLTSAAGINIYDAMRNAQKELSRELFPGHREVILIGQQLAERGISHLLDQFVRNPRSELRSKLFVVKDARAKDVLRQKATFEPFTSMAIKRQEDIFRLRYVYFHDFLSDTLTEGLDPFVPAIGLTAQSKPYYYGSAVFNKAMGLKMVGFLNDSETVYANWITGKQNGYECSLPIGGGADENVSVSFESLSSSIRTRIARDRITIGLRLSGNGAIVENNSDLNPTVAADRRAIEQAINDKTKREIEALIAKVQRAYRADIFGFGEAVHRQHPVRWKALSGSWNDRFAKLQVAVQVDLSCVRNSGLVTTPIHED